MVDKEFVQYVIDILSPYGAIKARSMFGGYGIYKDNIITAIIVNNELYFKVNDANINDYKNYGCQPFAYIANQKTIQMSYWRVPVNILEDSTLLGEWFNKAWQASLQAKKKNQKPL